MGLSFNQCSADAFQHAHQILIYIAVPESKHFEFTTRKVFVSRDVFSSMNIVVVLPTVDLDDQFKFQAHKIDNETVSRRLTAKMKSFTPP